MGLEARLRLTLPSFDLRVEMSLPSRGYAVLLGPSGSGKSLTLKLLAGLQGSPPQEIRLDGRPVGHLPPEHRNIVYLPQGNALFPHLSVKDNLLFAFRARNESPEPTFLEEVLRVFRLKSLLDRHPRNLSGGEAQRVALARAICARPRVLLLDEPLSSLDFHLKLELMPFLKGLPARFGVLILHVTHDPLEALFLAERIYLLHKGRLLFGGTLEEFQRLARTPSSQELLEALERFAHLISQGSSPE